MKRAVVVVITGVVVLFMTGYLALSASLPQLGGRVFVRDLDDVVVVGRDALGIPTVRGKHRSDVAWATGFLHAQDRFFQMDLMRRDGAGELAALVGPGAVARDKQRRVHRLRRVAGQVLAQASPGERALLEAYAAGVNAGLGALRLWPFEQLR